MKKLLAAAMAALLVTVFPLFPTAAAEELDFFDLHNLTEREDGYYTVKNEADGEILLCTARLLHVGDRYIDAGNRLFRVVRVEEDIAWARMESEGASASSGASPAGPKIPVQGRDNQRKIAVYHSHGAESYVPTDGTDSIPQGGGIIRVGDTFSQALENSGVDVIHSRETHVPHDAGAYNRSRRTAEELLADAPDAVFDVHRDAVPPENYAQNVKGENVVQITMVVGRQNQNVDNNLAFAKELKNMADAAYPGLIKGILMPQGNFNQDLSARALLLEVGAHENSREQAEESITFFADVVTDYLYGTAEGKEQRGAQPDTPGGAGGLATSSAIKLLVALGLALFVYLLVAAGSWEALKHKVSDFFRREFADFRRGIKLRGRDDEEER